MTTKDLKQISDLLENKLEEKLEQKLEEKLEQKLEEKLSPIRKELESHGKELKKHTKALRSLKKDQDTMLIMLNREQMDQRKRIKRIEDHLEFPAINS